jgi:hypothetical protein
VTQRDRIVLCVVAAVVALGGFWMLALKPKRQEASDLGTQLTQAQQRLDGARASVDAGDAARTKYANNYATVARLGKAVPVDDDVPSLVYQLDSTAKESGVDFRTMKLSTNASSAATPSTAAQGAAATQDNAQNKAAGQTGEDAGGNAAQSNNSSSSSSSSSASSSSSGSTPPPATSSPTQADTAALPPGAAVGPAGLSTMPFTFTFTGSFFKLSDFMTKLERYIKAKRSGTVDVRGRLLLINGISLTAASKGFPTMKASVAAQAYLLPVDQGLFDGASPTGPSAVSASQPGDSGSGAAPPVAPATVTP